MHVGKMIWTTEAFCQETVLGSHLPLSGPGIPSFHRFSLDLRSLGEQFILPPEVDIGRRHVADTHHRAWARLRNARQLWEQMKPLYLPRSREYVGQRLDDGAGLTPRASKLMPWTVPDEPAF